MGYVGWKIEWKHKNSAIKKSVDFFYFKVLNLLLRVWELGWVYKSSEHFNNLTEVEKMCYESEFGSGTPVISQHVTTKYEQQKLEVPVLVSIFLPSSLFKSISLHYQNPALFTTFKTWCQLDFLFYQAEKEARQGYRSEKYLILFPRFNSFFPLYTSLNVMKNFKAKSAKWAAPCQ